ncbi:MAG: four helix bundle protein [Ignavibacterium sp.]|jgi:four helix bundle protein|nr:four helix bundle protein [Ignavibacterium sp.]MDX9713613.1 four helix bundle protein [Ignavibacteriaceae bacterium]MEB2355416.1 four helix bundle protein [Ignavibacteriales bacterium]GIK20627.1 MAG: four helix bundle protein [Ignavibacteriota bacterium]
MKVKTFEDLQVWQDARTFVKSIYELTSLENFRKDYDLKDQIQRAAVSIMNNIAEGFETDNNKEFRNFLGYAKGSAGEVRSMLFVAIDLNYISKDKFDENYKQAINVITQISNFKKYLHNYAVKEKVNKMKMFIIHLLSIN